jgi:hypothetical protein
MKFNSYTRADAVVGVGFVIAFAGRNQHSIAWPDRPSERYMSDELAEHRIAVEEMNYGNCDDGCKLEIGREVEGVGRVFNVNTDGVHIDDIAADPVVGENETIVEAVVEVLEDSPTLEESPGIVESPEVTFEFLPRETEATNIRNYLTLYPEATNQDVITALHGYGMEVSSSQVSYGRKSLAKLTTETTNTTVESESV